MWCCMLELHLFGTPQVLQDSQDLTADVGAKSLALISFLAISNSPVPRQKLAGTFWSDKTEEASRYRLRHSLWDLNRLLPKEFIQSNDGNCWLQVDKNVRIDVLEFQQGTQALGVGTPNYAISSDQIAPLTLLKNLYRGEFLECIIVRGAPLFDEWLLVEREQLQVLYLDVLWNLARTQQLVQDYASAAQTLAQLIALDPLHERGYRALMVVHFYRGDHAAAVRVYKQCAMNLAAELGVAPSPGTEQVRELIAKGTLASVQSELELASKLVQEQRYREAWSVCATIEALTADPITRSKVALLRAEIAIAQGRNAESLGLVQAARQAVSSLFSS